MRRLPALLVLVLAACTSSIPVLDTKDAEAHLDGSPDAQPPDAGPDAHPRDAGPDASEPDLSTCAGRARAICESLDSCAPAVLAWKYNYGFGECVVGERERCEQEVEALRPLDPVECVRRTTASCDSVRAMLMNERVEGCETPAGVRAHGESCLHDAQCGTLDGDALICVGTRRGAGSGRSTCPGRCQRAIPAGERCAAADACERTEGIACVVEYVAPGVYGDEHRCLPLSPVGEGEACRPDSQRTCAEGLTCGHDWTCVPYPREGERCGRSVEGAILGCDPREGLLVCLDDTCRELHDVIRLPGEACAPLEMCAFTYSCPADGRCWAETRPADGSCTDGEVDCPVYQNCVDGRCEGYFTPPWLGCGS